MPEFDSIKTTEIEDAYAAGFLDGEGCILITCPVCPKNGVRYHRLDVRLTQVDPAPLTWLAQRYGGRVQPNSKSANGRLVRHWCLTGIKAEMFLRRIRKYMITKAAQADVALEYRKTVKLRPGHCTPAVVAERTKLSQTLSDLKHFIPGVEPLPQKINRRPMR